ncbi:MAG: GtrA family protein [bacterium]|nr:GtrA family protein [bacterium]
MEFIGTKNIILKFVTTGLIVAAVQLLLFYILNNKILIPYLFSSTAAFIVAFFTNFFLQKFWTFKDVSDKTASQLGLFFANSMLNLVGNVALMFFLVEYVTMLPLLAQIITMGVLMMWNFLIYKKIFRS